MKISKDTLKKEELFNNQYTGAKVDKMHRIIDAGSNPFPNSKGIERSILAADFNEQYKNAEGDSEISVTLIGRVKLHRKQGKSGFINLTDPSGSVQGFASLDDTKNYDVFKLHIDVGDIVMIEGYPFTTNTSETTVKIRKIKVVTKSTGTPIGKHVGLQDEETKFRKRYLDMIANPDVKDKLVVRSQVISTIRRFMEKKGFNEVETPTLNPIPGGANARPFITFHNALDAERYLRIAPELYLKRLVVGGMEKVFEIGKNFRNEGVDATHNPEFTSIEFYEAYSTYKQHMKMTEKLFKKIYRKVFGNEDYILPYGEDTIDLNDWKKITFRDSLISIGGVPEEVVDDADSLTAYLLQQGAEKANSTMPLGKLWEIAFDEFVEEKLVNPTFIIDYPADISPLARRKDKNPDLTERFELFVAGRELANGFNELNNPFDQYERFVSQVEGKDLEDEDDESMHMDKDFVEALMHGMPPSAGTGIGIDRLVMLFTNSHTIREVIAFPAMK